MSLDVLSFIKGTELIFNDDFDQSLDKVTFPQSLTSITFGWNFNQSLDNVIFPQVILSLNAHTFLKIYYQQLILSHENHLNQNRDKDLIQSVNNMYLT